MAKVLFLIGLLIFIASIMVPGLQQGLITIFGLLLMGIGLWWGLKLSLSSLQGGLKMSPAAWIASGIIISFFASAISAPFIVFWAGGVMIAWGIRKGISTGSFWK